MKHFEIISEHLSSEFERKLYMASLGNLADQNNPLRLNNFAYAIRELTRHILHGLAPDKCVLSCSWYKNQTDKENGITRRQRAYYAVQGGLDDEYIEKELDLDVFDIHSNLVKAIENLSKLTHINESTFNLSSDKVDLEVATCLSALNDFLQLIDTCRDEIRNAIWDQIDQAVVDEALRDTILSIDELANHSWVDEIYVDEAKIVSINHECVSISVAGTIGCELQWGSNSDLRKGDGAIASQSFPFDCELLCPTDDPKRVECVEGSFNVDTDSWFKDRYE